VSDETKVEKDLVYKTVNGEDLKFDLYLPAKPAAEKAPVIYLIPGGGWMIHNRNRRNGYASLFTAMGAAVMVIDHRLSPAVRFPDNVIDCVDGLNYIPEISEKYGLDTENVTIMGDSSGGHLSSLIASCYGNPEQRQKLGVPEFKVKLVGGIFVSGVYAIDILKRLPIAFPLIVKYPTGVAKKKDLPAWPIFKEMMPINNVTKDFPPCFMSDGKGDPLCSGDAGRFGKVLTAAGVKNTVDVGTRLTNGHCYIYRIKYPYVRKHATNLFTWYVENEKAQGVDMTAGLERIKKFFANYKKALKGKVEC
jgi:acetyl esterase/lipase